MADVDARPDSFRELVHWGKLTLVGASIILLAVGISLFSEELRIHTGFWCVEDGSLNVCMVNLGTPVGIGALNFSAYGFGLINIGSRFAVGFLNVGCYFSSGPQNYGSLVSYGKARPSLEDVIGVPQRPHRSIFSGLLVDVAYLVHDRDQQR